MREKSDARQTIAPPLIAGEQLADSLKSSGNGNNADQIFGDARSTDTPP
jgi:hypothetical protein